MATKPSVQPRLWASLANYDTGPYIGQPMKVDPGIGPSASGHRPGITFPTPAEYENYQQYHITNWVTTWLSQGSSLGGANTHIIESNAAGRFSAVGAAYTGDASGTTVSVIAGTNVNGVDILGNGTGRALAVQSSGSVESVNIINSGAGAGTKITSNSGNGLEVTGSGAIGVLVDGGTSYGLFLQAGTNGIGGIFAGDGAGAAIYAVGGNAASTNGISCLCDSVDGFGLLADTNGSATSASRAGRFVARGSAMGIEAVAAGNHALRIQGDTTSPTFAAMSFVATNAYPSNFGDGQVAYVNTGVAGVAPELAMSSALDSAYRGIWTSLGGFVYGGQYNQTASNATAGTYVNVCTVNLAGHNAPKVSGYSLRITVTMRVGVSAAAADTCNVRVRDTTAGTTLFTKSGTGFGSNTGFYITPWTGAAGYTTTIAFDFLYFSVPAAGARTLVLEFGPQGAGTLNVNASLVVTGSYS